MFGRAKPQEVFEEIVFGQAKPQEVFKEIVFGRKKRKTDTKKEAIPKGEPLLFVRYFLVGEELCKNARDCLHKGSARDESSERRAER